MLSLRCCELDVGGRLPHDLPPESPLLLLCSPLAEIGVWQKRNNAVPGKVPQQKGRESQASAGSADSQSVKTTEKGSVTRLRGR